MIDALAKDTDERIRRCCLSDAKMHIDPVDWGHSLERKRT